MSLRGFHVFFIVAAALLAFGFGIWGLMHADESASIRMLGVASLLAGVALVVYLGVFHRKVKTS